MGTVVLWDERWSGRWAWAGSAACWGTRSCAGEWYDPCMSVLPADVHDPRVRGGALWIDARQPAGQSQSHHLVLYSHTSCNNNNRLTALRPWLPGWVGTLVLLHTWSRVSGGVLWTDACQPASQSQSLHSHRHLTWRVLLNQWFKS